MARTNAELTQVMIVQQLIEEQWGLYPADVRAIVRDALAAAEGGKADPGVMHDYAEQLGNVLLRAVDDIWPVVGAYAIIHDKDVQEVWDADTQGVVECPKVAHIHFYARFETKGGTTLAIADAVKFPQGQVEKPKQGRFAADNWMAYLIHAKDADKYPYPAEQVATLMGRDYIEIRAERAEAWKKGRSVKKAQAATSDEAVDDLFERCLSGEIRKPQILLSDNLIAVYSRNRRKIDDALKTYAEARMWKAAEALLREEFKIQVYFITGPPRSGKSWFAEQFIADQIANAPAGERWEFCRASSTNPLDKYRGEEILLMDDLRPGAMDATNWLQLLDPHRPSTASARYEDKENVAPRVIVITSYLDPVDFFFFVKSRGGQDESMNQFIDRLRAIVRVLPEKERVRYLVDVIGKRKPYERTVAMADGTLKRVHLEHGMIARGRTEDKGEMIEFLTQGVLASGQQTMFQIGSSSTLDIINGELIVDEERDLLDEPRRALLHQIEHLQGESHPPARSDNVEELRGVVQAVHLARTGRYATVAEDGSLVLDASLL